MKKYSFYALLSSLFFLVACESVDRDRDELVEIRTAAHLDAVRHQLDGSGRRLSAGSGLNTFGCSGFCEGYELVANINLTNYIRDNYGSEGWQPIGDCNDPYDTVFEGNGHTISGLRINRASENCVGLFGRLNDGKTIRNLILQAEEIKGRDVVGSLVGEVDDYGRIISSSVVVGQVSGEDDVGGLVGYGRSVEITSSSAVVGEVSGNNATGGLVGYGRSVEITSSSVEAGQVSGEDEVGGLVGYGRYGRILFSSVEAGQVSGEDDVGGLVGAGYSSRIVSSSVLVGNVSGNNTTGGLVGAGYSSRIIASSVLVGEVSGNNATGGLVGWDRSPQIVSSLVVVEEVSGNNAIGGLIGDGRTGQIAFSLVVTGNVSGNNATGALVGRGGISAHYSYWDGNTSGIATGNHGVPKTSADLTMPISYTGTYATWDDGVDIDNRDNDNNTKTGIDRITIYCDEDNNGNIEGDEFANRIWDFGTSSQYPAIRCTPIAPDDWRKRWSLDGDGRPQLNWDRLNQTLDALPSSK